MRNEKVFKAKVNGKELELRAPDMLTAYLICSTLSLKSPLTPEQIAQYELQEIAPPAKG